MDGARSVCLIYDRKNAFEACYLKEFFKMTGFSYVDYLYVGGENDGWGMFRDNHFDILVDIGRVMPLNVQHEFADKTDTMFLPVTLDDCEEKSAGGLLKKLLIFVRERPECRNTAEVLDLLADIYIERNLMAPFYEYTLVLHQKMEYQFARDVCDRLEVALQDIERLIESRECRGGMEYLLYAKYACQIRVNDFLLVRRQMERYDIEELFDYIDEIYRYDDKYYKAQYLKALAANQNCMYDALANHLFSDCIRSCPVNVCKSYYYYCLGKWNTEHNRSDEASDAFHASLKTNPYNIKAVFKLAVEAKRKGETGRTKKYLQQIVDIWEGWEDMRLIPLHDMEYAYKSRKLCASVVDDIFSWKWDREANRFMDAVEPDTYMETGTELSFAGRLYSSYGDAYIRAALDAMRRRVNILYELKII